MPETVTAANSHTSKPTSSAQLLFHSMQSQSCCSAYRPSPTLFGLCLTPVNRCVWQQFSRMLHLLAPRHPNGCSLRATAKFWQRTALGLQRRLNAPDLLEVRKRFGHDPARLRWQSQGMHGASQQKGAGAVTGRGHRGRAFCWCAINEPARNEPRERMAASATGYSAPSS